MVSSIELGQMLGHARILQVMTIINHTSYAILLQSICQYGDNPQIVFTESIVIYTKAQKIFKLFFFSKKGIPFNHRYFG